MKKIITELISLVFENSCLICNASSNNNLICKNCKEAIEQKPKKSKRTFKEIEVYSWGLYDGRLRDAILALKSGKKKLANYFGQELIAFWNTLPQETKNKNFLVIPIPSHKKRIKERGYCQSALIAQDFANCINQHFSKNFVTRTKETKYMNSLSSIDERFQNIKDAFFLTDVKPEEKNILIIDDILTSGSTMCELAKTIHQKYKDLNLVGLTVASGDTFN